MSFAARISECKKFIRITYKCPITYDLALSVSEHVYSMAAEHGIRNYFFDVRGVRNCETTENNYRLVTEDVRRIGFDRTDKIAILIDDDDDSHDFIETAACSAGFNCKIFTCEDSLLEWIRI